MATVIDTERIFSSTEVKGRADSDAFMYAAGRSEKFGDMFASLVLQEVQRAYLVGYANAIIWMQQAALGREQKETKH